MNHACTSMLLCLMAIAPSPAPASPATARLTLANVAAPPVSPAARPAIIDTLSFGDAASEQAHRTSADTSDVITGALGEPARRPLV